MSDSRSRGWLRGYSAMCEYSGISPRTLARLVRDGRIPYRKLSAKLLRKTLPEDFSTTIAYPLPGTKFYEQMRDRLIFERDWQLDWDYTAENRLLFQRERYNTFFYRLVIRWFHKEWEDAWLIEGEKTTMWRRMRIKLGLWAYRSAAAIMARSPMTAGVRFEPAPGR